MEEQLRAFQDEYPEDTAHCYGCGRLNVHGHQLKSYWAGEEGIARFTPKPYHTAISGFVYGGLIASIVDCHGTGTAAAAVARAHGWELGAEEPPPGEEVPRFVTASLHVDYRRPTPLGPELEARARVREQSDRKVVVDVTVSAEGEVTATGTVVAVRMPGTMARGD